MRIPSHDAAGKLILRLTVAFVVLLHGVAKLIGGVDGIAGMLTGIGLPAFFAYAVFLGEVVGPTLMIAGFHARAGAILVALNMIVALALVHGHELFSLNQQGGWAIELQALMLFGAIASMLLGPGRYAINDK